MSRHDDHRTGGPIEFLWLTVVLLLGFLVQPGILTVYCARQVLGLTLDRGQLWSFGAVTSVATYSLLSAARKSWGSALGTYTLLCVAASITLCLSHWGFHAQWPRELLALLFGS